MITEIQAIRLLKKYNLPDPRISHSIGVAKTAFEIASKIHKSHPNISLDPEKVKVAALLHDIGRSIPGDHEPNTVKILQSEGLEDIASITMHGSYYEIMLLRGVDNPQLIPQTVENKIVAYADACFKDHPVSMEQRWAEIESRRKDENEKIKSLHMAKDRFKQMEKDIKELLKSNHYL